MTDPLECIPKVRFWYPQAIVYDALKSGSIDGTDTVPHDKAICRAMNSTYHPNSKVKGIPENTIFISRLNNKTSESRLKSVFKKYGKIRRLRLVRDVITGHSKKYAFVEYKNEQEAFTAIDRTDRMVLDDHCILVDHECERLLPGWVPRRLGGGFGGNKKSGQLRFGGKRKSFEKPINLMDEYELKKKSTQFTSTE